ncbi:hypothetical protein [Actinophytocola oryzae]|uniref:Uncharacterized protein n=1 Tax=Actinophytocola oryzae TaxID=502181 RepID=A0A4R7VVL0_9PSEU|nr:hypothetical protein [Actinophytocola oryzae]TDV53934.1 hypothetical protein CLV71_104402 [Actinophytocola oryzae]
MTAAVETIATTYTDEVSAEVTALLEAPERADDLRDLRMLNGPLVQIGSLSPSGPRKPKK